MRRTKGSVVQPATSRVLSKLGKDIALSRRARRLSTEDFAARAGISRATLHRLEKGDPGVSLNTLAMALHVLGRLDLLKNLIDPMNDDVGLMLMRGQVPKRIFRGKARKAGEGAADTPRTDVMEW